MHNMIIADDGYNISVKVLVPCTVAGDEEVKTDVELQVEHNETNVGYIARRLAEIEDKDARHLLRRDLIEHLWSRAGEQDG